MEEQSLADLAREYGLDGSEYEDTAGDEYVMDHDESMGYNEYPTTEYGDPEDHNEGRFVYAHTGSSRINHSRCADSSYYPEAWNYHAEVPICSSQRMNNYGRSMDDLRSGNSRQRLRHNEQESQTVALPMHAAYSSSHEIFQGGRSDEAKDMGPRNVHGIRLRPTSDLPDMYRALFKFGVFNAVQSSCFDKVMKSDDNLVISAPTGSGKTVIFELAIIRMLLESRTSGRDLKCIYVAPTKALCSEKYRDWVTKFQPLGINCCELTGDTVKFGKSAWGDAKHATIIVTTGEKWDSLTRNWEEHEQTLSQIQLFLVDEVHILNESRGSTLEVIVSRMKARGTSVRFVMVSATVPNVYDVARWIGNSPHGGPAIVMEFGEEYRPCKLTRHVYGIPRKGDQNDFVFSRNLDFKLYGILKQHSVNKPVLVFCATRKGVMTTAEQLMKEYEQSTQNKDVLPWSRPRRIETTFQDKRLEKLATCGLGVHHAGMSLDDRRATEDLYLNKVLRIIIATSTLAVGVNLPAHTVVIKGVKMFQGNIWKEYSDLDITQMMGRAGRPQFDKEGVAIIMCESELKQKYEALAQGRTFLESSLHLNLSEHINSEIGLGTICNIPSAKEWLTNSFLYQRIQQNPKHYGIGRNGNQTWQERVGEMVNQSIEKLKENQLVAIADGGSDAVKSTEYGDIMSKYYIRQSTMGNLLKLPERATLRDMLEMLCTAEEFGDIKIRNGEKQIYNKLRSHDDIRYKPKKVEKTCDKVYVIVQAVLAGLNLNDPEYKNGDNQPSLEALTIFRHIERIARAMLEVALVKKSGSQIKHGMELLRCLNAKAWEDRPVVLRQIEHIGEKSIKVLAQHGITSLADVRKQDPLRIETLLNRKSPFGYEILAYIKQLPQYKLEISESSITPSDGTSPVEVELLVECGLVDDISDGPQPKRGKMRFREATMLVTVTSDLDYIDFRRIPTKSLKSPRSFSVIAKLFKPSQTVLVQITPESTAGLSYTKVYKPNLSHGQFPTLDTRPLSTAAQTMDGIVINADFWAEMEEGPSDVEEVPVKDLTKGLVGGSVIDHKHGKEKIAARRDNQGSAPAPGPPMFSKKLPNGNYACNHTCKDKATCRHLCCREGLKKPPQLTKRRVETTFPVNDTMTLASTNKSRLKVPTEKTHERDRPDRRMEQLESLHKRNGVTSSLQIPEGKRIKLDHTSRTAENSSSRAKPKPNFDIEFSDVNAADALDWGVTEIAPLSDDDVPSVRDLVEKSNSTEKKAEDSDSLYDDSEVDAFIRGFPTPPPFRAFSSSPHSVLYGRLDTPSSPTFGRGKKRENENRYEKEQDSDDLQHSNAKRHKTVTYASTPTEPLFYPADEEGDPEFGDDIPPSGLCSAPLASSCYDDDFEIDHSIFDIKPHTTSPRLRPPIATGSSSASHAPIDSTPKFQIGFPYLLESGSSSRRSASVAGKYIPVPVSEAKILEGAQEPSLPKTTTDPGPEIDPFANDLAELEAWLQSDAVVIVDRLD